MTARCCQDLTDVLLWKEKTVSSSHHLSSRRLQNMDRSKPSNLHLDESKDILVTAEDSLKTKGGYKFSLGCL